MSYQPKVTIVIPVFNGENFLREAINSALAQTYPNLEILVVNDGSKDQGATERIALSYGDKIRYLSQENGGVASALNTAIKNMSGEYFSWLSHDDLYFPDKIAAQIGYLATAGNNAVLYSDFGIFYDNPENLIVYRVANVAPEDFRYSITADSPVNGCTLLVPKKAFDECGIFNEALRHTQDYDLWFRIASKYRFVHQGEVMVKSRSHPGQDSLKMKDDALKEVTALIVGFARSLTEAELTRKTRQSRPVAYAILAARFAFRGYHSAASDLALFAADLARSASWGDRIKIRWHRWRAARFVPLYRFLRGYLTRIRGFVRRHAQW